MNTLSLLAIDKANLWKSWEIMWKGVVAIFLVIALVIIVTKVVNTVCVTVEKKREEKKKQEEEQGVPKQ